MTTKNSEMQNCRLNDILFPISINDNPRETNQEYSKVVTGLVPVKNEKTGNVEIIEKDLNYCSPRYELVPNANIFPVVEQILKQNNIEFSVTYKQRNNAMFYAEYVLEDQRFAYKINGTNDVIKFRFSFQHSYNGQVKYLGIAGFYRLVCSNGLVISVPEMDEYNLILTGKHTKIIKESLIKFNDVLNNVVNNLDTVKSAVTKKYEILANISRVKVNQRIENVLNACKINIIENNKFNIYDYLNNIISSEMMLLGYSIANDWLIYNAINRYIYDDSLNISAPEKRREKDSKVLEYMLKY